LARRKHIDCGKEMVQKSHLRYWTGYVELIEGSYLTGAGPTVTNLCTPAPGASA
jgi:hypothetical protein